MEGVHDPWGCVILVMGVKDGASKVSTEQNQDLDDGVSIVQTRGPFQQKRGRRMVKIFCRPLTNTSQTSQIFQGLMGL